MDKDSIEDKLTIAMRQRDKLVLEVNSKTEEIISLLEIKNSMDPTLVKVDCVQCLGSTMIRGEDGKHVKCPTCRGSGYLWMKRFINKED